MECKRCGVVDVEPVSGWRTVLLALAWGMAVVLCVGLAVIPPYGFFLTPVVAPGVMGVLAAANSYAREEPLCPHCGRIVSTPAVPARALPATAHPVRT